MPIRLWVVEGQIRQVAPVDVLLLCYLWCHYYSCRIDSVCYSFSLQVFQGVHWVLKYPEHRVGHCLQYVHPDFKRHWIKFVHLVEVCEDEFILRQVVLLSRRAKAPWLECLSASLSVIVEKVRVGHVNCFFGVELLNDFWR